MNYTRHFECGCKVVVIGELTNAVINYCPKHKAAPDMYKALMELDYCYSSSAYQDRERVANAWVEAKKVLTKAEGK